jgi:hypothetical protein
VVDADREIVHVLQLRVSDVSTALSGDFCEAETVNEFCEREGETVSELSRAQRDVQMWSGKGFAGRRAGRGGRESAIATSA